MAHLKTQQTAHDTAGRLQWKVQIVKGLYRKGFSREDILELFRFIDWLMILPEALENQFAATLQQFEQEEQMQLKAGHVARLTNDLKSRVFSLFDQLNTSQFNENIQYVIPADCRDDGAWEHCCFSNFGLYNLSLQYYSS